MASSLSMIIIISMLIVMVPKSSSFPTFFYHVCSNSSTYHNNSNYQNNLNTLLTFLSNNASTNPNGFYTTSVGRTENDTVNGFFMCRGDQNTSQCSDCVATAVKDRAKTSNCPRSKHDIIYYDECMLRYDDRVLAGKIDQTLYVYQLNSQNITGNQTEFEQSVQSTMSMLSTRAAQSHGKKYVTTATDCNQCTSGKLYILEQCVPDLTNNDCFQCLESVRQSLQGSRQGGRSYLPSCNARYEMYPFFVDATSPIIATPPTASTPTPPVASPPTHSPPTPMPFTPGLAPNSPPVNSDNNNGALAHESSLALLAVLGVVALFA